MAVTHNIFLRTQKHRNFFLTMHCQSYWLVLVLVQLQSGLVTPYSTAQYEHGTPMKQVVTLNNDNFHQAVNSDPANSFWFLKFFAPWCGHCKKLAPVLDKVAPQTTGTMSIGTIDCTVEKKLCNQYKVSGYPTLKFALDGEIYNYDGGRKERDLIEFSKKILRPTIESVDSVSTIMENLSSKTEYGIAFLFYDPTITFNPDSILETNVASTSLGQLFAQVSRQLRAEGSFFILDPSESTTPEDIALAMQLKDTSNGPFLCRMEENVPPRCFDSLKSATPLKQYVEWVEEQNVPTVSQLGPHNFHKFGQSGRHLAIAIINEEDQEQLDITKQEFTQYAISGPPQIRDKYYYAYFDGNQWKDFLAQFEVFPHDMPQILVLDVPIQAYYQNATYKLNLDDFLHAIENGHFKSKFAGLDSLDGKLMLLYRFIILYRPWSIMLIAVLLIAIIVAIWLCVRPSKEMRKLRTTRPSKLSVEPPPTTTIESAPQDITLSVNDESAKEECDTTDKKDK